MEKVVIKMTVIREVEPDLYASISGLPLRQRSSVVRRLWREGVKSESRAIGTVQAANLPDAAPAERAAPAVDNKIDGADGELLRKDLAAQGLLGLSAFV